MAYRTKADHIRALMKEGLSKKEIALRTGASYTQVHGLYMRQTGAQVKAARIAASKAKLGKPFAPGTRVVHKRQIAKGLFGIVVSSDPLYTRVSFTLRNPPPELHYCRFYEGVHCIHDPKREGKLLPPVSLFTVELEVAPGSAY
jgi:hypothetical protein